MDIIETASGCPVIDQLIESSKTLGNGKSARKVYHHHLKWIPYSEFTDIESIEHSADNQPTYYATYEQDGKLVEMLRIGTVDECLREFIHEFAKTYSLPTHKYYKPSN